MIVECTLIFILIFCLVRRLADSKARESGQRRATPCEQDTTMSTDEPVQSTLKPLHFSHDQCHLQAQSLLFSVLPPELRDRVFAWALAQYEDPTAEFDRNTYYHRPDYSAPRRSDTALLRTCRLIYCEAWFRPWTSKEHTIFLAAPERRPERVETQESLQQSLNTLVSPHDGQPLELSSVRIFPQLYQLESGRELRQYLAMPNFLPREVTMTIRHSDWWYWESDEKLRLGGRWVEKCRFPNSVKVIRLELETLERKKEQVEDIASQMIAKWRFRRYDGVLLSATEKANSVTRWQGSSMLQGQRWLRDETSRPETLDYFVLTISWHPQKASRSQVQASAAANNFSQTTSNNTPSHDKTDNGASNYQDTESSENPSEDEYDHSLDLRSKVGSQLPTSFNDNVDIRSLSEAQIAPGTPAAEVRRQLEIFYRSHLIRPVHNRRGHRFVHHDP